MKKVISVIVILLIVAGIAGAIYLSQETKKDQSATKGNAATNQWGRIANTIHNGEKLRAPLFFAGPPNPEFLGYYTRTPADNMWDWDSPDDVDKIFNEMQTTYVNVIKLSWWGVGEEITWSPTIYTDAIHQQVFEEAEQRNILVAPFLEVSQWFKFWEEYPNDTQGLIDRIEIVLEKYGSNPNWLEVYNKDGEARKVIWLIETIHLGSVNESKFASTFDTVADKVYADTGVKIGFIIDPTPLPPNGTYAGPNCTELAKRGSILAVNPFNITSDGNTESQRLAKAEQISQKWNTCEIPYIAPMLLGFDDHLVRTPYQIYGDNDNWIEKVKQMTLKYEQAGISLDIWNGFTEGYAFTPTKEQGSKYLELAKEVFLTISPDTANPVVPPVFSSADMCAELDTDANNEITLVDLANLISNYKKTCVPKDSYEACGSQDSNNDGEISLVDLSNLLSKYNKSCE